MIKQKSHKTMDLYNSLVDKVIELNSLTEKERLELISKLNSGNFESCYSDKLQKKKQSVTNLLFGLYKQEQILEFIKVVSEPRLTLVASLSGKFESFITISRLTTMRYEDFIFIVFDEVKDDFMKILEAIRPFDEVVLEDSNPKQYLKLRSYSKNKEKFKNSDKINELLNFRLDLLLKPFERINANELFDYSKKLYNKSISLINEDISALFILEVLISFYQLKTHNKMNFIKTYKKYDPFTVQFIIDAISFRATIIHYLKSRKRELSFKNKILLNLELKRLKKNGYLNSYRFLSSTPINSGSGFLSMNANFRDEIILGY
jgi:hypothetical protein